MEITGKQIFNHSFPVFSHSTELLETQVEKYACAHTRRLYMWIQALLCIVLRKMMIPNLL